MVFFAPLRFVLRSLGVALRLVSVVFAIRVNYSTTALNDDMCAAKLRIAVPLFE